MERQREGEREKERPVYNNISAEKFVAIPLKNQHNFIQNKLQPRN